MKIDITVIKYLLIILAASFLFTCVAEDWSGKPLSARDTMALQIHHV